MPIVLFGKSGQLDRELQRALPPMGRSFLLATDRVLDGRLELVSNNGEH